MKTAQIRLQFVCANDFASRLIAWYGNGYGGFSHVDAVMPTIPLQLLGARNDGPDGTKPGVQLRPVGYAKWVRRAIVAIDATAPVVNAWEHFLYSQIDKKYNQQAIWGFVLGRRDKANGRWICSQLQTAALRHCGLLHNSPTPDSQVTPDTLFEVVTRGLGAKVVLAEGL